MDLPSDTINHEDLAPEDLTSEEPRAGDVWHVLMEGATACMTVLVVGVSRATVLLDEDGRGHPNPTRYPRSCVRFLERLARRAGRGARRMADAEPSGPVLEPAYRTRVREERDARHAELARLREFLVSPKFAEVPQPEATLLLAQAALLSSLVELLSARINCWRLCAK